MGLLKLSVIVHDHYDYGWTRLSVKYIKTL